MRRDRRKCLALLLAVLMLLTAIPLGMRGQVNAATEEDPEGITDAVTSQDSDYWSAVTPTKRPTNTPTKAPTPAKPTNLKTKLVTATKANISWNKVSGATGYEVFRSNFENM